MPWWGWLLLGVLGGGAGMWVAFVWYLRCAMWR